jgi:hypothetical protein
MTCQHENFSATVKVNRLTDEGGGPVIGYMAEITVICGLCKTPFQFLGLEPGIDMHGARVSLDGLEANLAIVPQGARPNPFQRLAFNIERHDA